MHNGHLALRAVAIVFFLIGSLSAIDMAIDLARGHISLNFGVLAFLVGVGLLRHRAAWRVVALVCACLSVVASLVLGAALLVGDRPIVYSGWGHAGALPASTGLVFALLALAVGIWQLWVLTRPRVRQLFQPAKSA